MFSKCAFTALALALAACKSTVPPLPLALPGTCSGDSECASNFRCDREMRRCVCTSDAACPGKFCNAFTGQCVDTVGGCTSNSSCASGQYCNTAVRTCQAITPFCQPCHSDNECGAGSACAAHPDFPAAGSFCVSACDAQGACTNGLSCRKSTAGASLCYPAGACGVSNACIPDSLKLCAQDADCGDPTQTCDQTLKACITRNATCPAGDACDPQSRLCVQACSSDNDCLQFIEKAPGYQCRANACFRLALCAQDSDCSSGQICQGNADGSKSCHAGCVTNADCPLGSGCNTTVAAHPRCAPGCTQNTDCALNTICAGAVCVSTTASCSSQTCQDTAACAVGGTCLNNCCVESDLPNTCSPSACAACPSAGCNVNCGANCFPLNLGAATSVAQCRAAFPTVGSVVYNGQLGQCQVLGHLQNCTSATDCPMKGFKCLASANVGCSGAGSVCFPTEQAAQAACGVGHP